MSTCILHAFISVLPASFLIGLGSSFMWGPLSGVGRDSNDPHNNWNLQKQKYGSAFKAWLRLFVLFTLVAYVVFAIAQIIKCYY